MPKGKPWSREQTKQLMDLRNEGKTTAEIADRMGKSRDAIKQKLRRLGLKVVSIENAEGTTTSSSDSEGELILPEDLPSIEEALLKLAAAMKALENPKLTKTDVMRLRTLIQTSVLYQKRFAEYVGYLKIERKVIEVNEWMEQHIKERQNEKINASEQDNLRS